MVTEILLCRHCQNNNVIKHGRDKRGVQRFRCHDCRHTFHKPEDDRGEEAFSRGKKADSWAGSDTLDEAQWTTLVSPAPVGIDAG